MKRSLLLAALVLFPIPVQAQVDRATLTGTVKDQLGAVIRGATVAVAHTGTNVTTHVRTTAEGVYLAPNLTSGTYTVAAEAQHFGTQSRAAILDAGQQARIDFSLMVGGVSEAVTVAEATRLLDTTQAAVGSVIDQSTFFLRYIYTDREHAAVLPEGRVPRELAPAHEPGPRPAASTDLGRAATSGMPSTRAGRRSGACPACCPRRPR